MSKVYISAMFKFLVGAIFIASATLKMSSIDSFELYIFSYNLFSLDMSALLARFVIGAEIVLGIGYLSNLYHKQFYYSILVALLLFTLLSICLMVAGRNDSCHCFGDEVDITPLQSIFKSVVLMVMLRISRSVPEWNFNFSITLTSASLERYRVCILLSIGVLVAVPFLRYPSHTLYNIVNNRGADYVAQRIDVEQFNLFVRECPEIDWGGRTKIVAFYGTHCQYCRKSAEQISQIIRRNSLSCDALLVAFWGDDKAVEEFKHSSSAVDFAYKIIHPKLLLDIVKGRVPTVVIYDSCVEGGVSILNTRSIKESDIVERLGE